MRASESLMDSSPMQSEANFTIVPNLSDSSFTRCFNENFSSGPLLGLPRCDIRIADPPSFSIFRMVGSTAFIRVRSVISYLSLRGTLKSTRTNAFLFLKLKESTVFINLMVQNLFSTSVFLQLVSTGRLWPAQVLLQALFLQV